MTTGVASVGGHTAALAQRIHVLAEVLVPGPEAVVAEPGAGWELAAVELPRIVGVLLAQDDPAQLWLALSTISTVLPDVEQFLSFSRGFRQQSVPVATDWLLRFALELALDRGTPQAAVSIRTDAVVVEVDFSARFNLHTGIQRVVRCLLPIWAREHAIVPVAWSAGHGALRTLDSTETERVLRWPNERAGVPVSPDDPAQWTVVIPWRSTVVLPEVPGRLPSARLEAIARFSGNRVGAIGYDCIPVISADLLPLAEPNKFVHYLSLIKHVDHVSGISESAADEFRGFVRALPAQGLSGPRVTACSLPAAAPRAGVVDRVRMGSEAGQRALVLCVGSFEPRKNQLGVLNAAERLWRAGLDFELRFVGGGGWGREFPTLLKALQRDGRPVSVATAISDDDLDALYERADFSVFPSLHEGYGLPVAESFAHGVPVVTSNYGSTAEIAAEGGAITVDPRDDEALHGAMQALLTDEILRQRLRAEIAKRSSRTWDDYAEQLWADLIEAQS